MNEIQKWLIDNIDRICKYLMFAATFFVGLCLGVVILYNSIEPEIIYVDRIVEIPSEPIVEVRYATEEEEKQRDWNEIEYLAKTVWGEARGCNNTQKAAVVWCILNRVDNDQFPNDIISVITAPNQFEGYRSSNPVEDDIVELVKDVLDRYELEQKAVGDIGRVLPKDYLFFRSSGTGINVFRQGFKSTEIWDWKDGTPYD